MEKERENRPYFDENKNYLDDEPKPLFDRKKVIEECEVFYPDLSKFEEREYNPVTK